MDWRYALIRVRRKLLAKADKLYFSLRLEWLKLRYGSVESAIEKGERLFNDIDDIESKCIGFAHVLISVCSHYKIEPFQTRIGGLYGDLLHNRLSCRENEEEIMSIVMNRYPGLEAHIKMLENGDIPYHKFKYYGPPPPFATNEDWLISLTEPNKS